MRIPVLYILAAIVAASVVSVPGCSNEAEETLAATGTPDNNEPAICKLEWWEQAADSMPNPIVSYDEKCIVQSYGGLELDEEPDECFPSSSKIVFEYRQNGVLVATAEREPSYTSRMTFKLFDTEGREVYTSINKDGYLTGPLPEWVWYQRYDEKGRLIDERHDFLNYYTINDELGLRDVWRHLAVGHDFPVYTDYARSINDGRLETSTEFGNCERHIYKSDTEPVVWPPSGPIEGINEACEIYLHHVRSDDKETFSGYYYMYRPVPSNADDRWTSVETSYNEKGLATESYSLNKGGNTDGSDYTSVTRWVYDDQGRVTREESDRGNDGTIDTYREYVYTGNVTYLRTVNIQDGEENSSAQETEYDANGNTIRRDSLDEDNKPIRRWVNTYDADGRLTYHAYFNSVYQGGKRIFAAEPESYEEYDYDALGNITRKKEVRWNYTADEDEPPQRTVEIFYTYEDGRLAEEKMYDSDPWWVYSEDGAPSSDDERFWRRTVYRHHCE